MNSIAENRLHSFWSCVSWCRVRFQNFYCLVLSDGRFFSEGCPSMVNLGMMRVERGREWVVYFCFFFGVVFSMEIKRSSIIFVSFFKKRNRPILI